MQYYMVASANDKLGIVISSTLILTGNVQGPVVTSEGKISHLQSHDIQLCSSVYRNQKEVHF
jgi:hypothetical protein